MDVYLHIPSSNSYKIYKNTDSYENIKYLNDFLQIIPKAKQNTNGLTSTIGVKIIESNNSYLIIFK